MLPYLAASGHNHYTKSVWIYLQQMSKLEDEHPDVYRHFLQGLYVVRRSDRLWAGLSTDLVIEQVLMRTLKTSGGLTRGRGMTEQQRLTWVMAMPVCAEVNKIMQDLTGIRYNTGEHNKDITVARQARDWKDTNTVLMYLSDRNPFPSDSDLQNISTGVHAHSTVDVDNAKAVRKVILDDMKGQSVVDYTFRRKNQAITMDIKSSVKIDGNIVQIDPQLLFQPLTLAARATHDVEAVFKYELCNYPPALFESLLLLREAQKPVLADAIRALLQPPDIPGVSGEVQYVLHSCQLSRVQNQEKPHPLIRIDPHPP